MKPILLAIMLFPVTALARPIPEIPGQSWVQAVPSDAAARAGEELHALMTDERYDDLYARFTDTLKARIAPTTLPLNVDPYIQQMGIERSVVGVRAFTFNGAMHYVRTISYSSGGELTFAYSFDADGNVHNLMVTGDRTGLGF